MANDDDSAQDDTLDGAAAAARGKSTRITVPHGCKYVRLTVAIESVIAVSAARGVFPPTYDFYAKDVTDNGEPIGEIHMDLSDGGGLALLRAKSNLTVICQKLGISPRDPHNPVVDDYEGTERQNLTYRITVDEWARLAAGYDVPFEVESAQGSLPMMQAEDVTADTLPAATPHISKAERQQARILGVLRGHGYDPMALPVARGKSGAKQAVWEDCKKDTALFTSESFEKAWQRLRKDRQIKDAPTIDRE
ncbi:hypothetical protein IAG25_10895 [Caballeronia sp. EK]|uniref:hypothetical protein n=1 Tax=Caballeronia sp. EK TaxID=2767469 RepID=UPI001654CCAC|nr:hypothetical protein [Caballeronia sp. EK]MBC8637319.1 hypothetical protein [Caballeronia sp. EK]